MTARTDATAEAIRRRAQQVCQAAPPLDAGQLAKLGAVLRGGRNADRPATR